MYFSSNCPSESYLNKICFGFVGEATFLSAWKEFTSLLFTGTCCCFRWQIHQPDPWFPPPKKKILISATFVHYKLGLAMSRLLLLLLCLLTSGMAHAELFTVSRQLKKMMQLNLIEDNGLPLNSPKYRHKPMKES